MEKCVEAYFGERMEGEELDVTLPWRRFYNFNNEVMDEQTCAFSLLVHLLRSRFFQKQLTWYVRSHMSSLTWKDDFLKDALRMPTEEALFAQMTMNQSAAGAIDPVLVSEFMKYHKIDPSDARSILKFVRRCESQKKDVFISAIFLQ